MLPSAAVADDDDDDDDEQSFSVSFWSYFLENTYIARFYSLNS